MNIDKKGSSLVEVLIIMFILSIAMMSINYIELINHKIAVNLHARGTASAIAQLTIDSLQKAGLNVLTDGAYIYTSQEDNRKYEIEYHISDWGFSDSLNNLYVAAKKVDLIIGWRVASDYHSINWKAIVE